MIRALEDDLADFALRELKAAKARWLDKQMSDDYAYTNGSMPAYVAQVEHWGRVAATIRAAYGVSIDTGETYLPYAPQELSNLCDANERMADSMTTSLHDYESTHPEMNEGQLSHYRWVLSEVKKFKRLSNFYAYLCGRGHPFAGIDMLPADIG
jgi:hypothetical protein